MTARTPGPAARLEALLARFSPEIAARAKGCLTRLRRAFPGTPQLVYDYANQGSVVVSFSPTERGHEGVVGLAVQPQRVQAYFHKDVPDPKGLLGGRGTKVRSVTIEDATDLDRGDVHALVAAAVKHAAVAFPGTRSSRLVFMSDAKKSPPKRSPAKTSRPKTPRPKTSPPRKAAARAGSASARPTRSRSSSSAASSASA